MIFKLKFIVFNTAPYRISRLVLNEFLFYIIDFCTPLVTQKGVTGKKNCQNDSQLVHGEQGWGCVYGEALEERGQSVNLRLLFRSPGEIPYHD